MIRNKLLTLNVALIEGKNVFSSIFTQIFGPKKHIWRRQLCCCTFIGVHYVSIRGNIYSQLSRCCTAGGSSTGCLLGGSAKVKAHGSFQFTEKFPCIENKDHLVDFVITIYICINTVCLVTILKVLRIKRH